MLYDRWRQVAQERARETAMVDGTSGRRWTFCELAQQTEQKSGDATGISFPQGLTPEFLLEVVRAWRNGRVVCPLDSDQARPRISAWPRGCAHFKMTSASTGTPRLIAFTGEQLSADAAAIVSTMGLRPDWPNLGLISLAHSYGFSNLVLPLLLHGIPLILGGSSPLPESVRRAAALCADITLASVPALWKMWFETGAIPPNVRLAISAGAPMPLALEQVVRDRHGLKIHNFYGASESGGIAYDRTLTPRESGECVGTALQGVELSLAGEGCLCVRSPAVGMTYWPEPDPKLHDGCFLTSDLADLIKGGVFLRGRLSEQINVAGRKVSPEVIERALAGHPLVQECLVFGAPSALAERSEMIVACVVSKSQVSSDILKQHLLSCLPAWQVPRDWWFVESLAANQRGKLSRAEWRKRYLTR
jgi:acyl-CoA synthetase (AMP-forming)/AMP-acid ligase II